MTPAKTWILIAAFAVTATALAQSEDDGYREARRALNRQQLTEAIAGFEKFRGEHPRSELVADSYYWEAFALERDGNLQRAVELIDTLERRHPDARVLDDARALRVRVCSELAQRGDGECAEALAATVRDPARLDEATRMAAVNALINMRADRAVPIAQRLAADKAQPVQIRKQALFVLANKADETADLAPIRAALRQVALDDTETGELREQAVFWLSRVPGDETLAMLTDLIHGSADTGLKTRAVFAIAQHDPANALVRLQGLARDTGLDTEVRKQAIFWIGREGNTQALPFLVDLDASLDDPELQRQLLFAVSQTHAPDAPSWLLGKAGDTSAPIELRKQALFWASKSGLEAGDLRELYGRVAEPELRQHLIWLIADRGGPGSLESLFDIALDDPDPEMRQKAVFWIGNSDDPRAADFILRLLDQ